MRHEDAGLALWVAGDQAARDRKIPCDELAIAVHASQASTAPSLRQRTGAAVIAFGERLAGEARPVPIARRGPASRQRLAGQRS